ncbi:MAG: hypothetical protein WBO19_15600 [Terriglobia bacterium]|jgi:hypothetical protein
MLRGAGGSQISFIRTAGFAPRSRGRELVKTALLCFCLIFAVATPARAQGSVGTFTAFDVPGAGAGVLQGTLPFSINAAGDIAGFYADTSGAWHGFVRAADGTITPFDAPGAGKGVSQGTFPISINTAGDIAGLYIDTNSVQHGFERTADGTLTEFNAPGASTAQQRGTDPVSIDTAGDITGTYTDTNSVWHGFLRTANGTIRTFDAPGAGTGSKLGTQPTSINSAGVITGNYEDANFVRHGFIRAANGTFTAPIDVPGAGTTGGGTSASNAVGTIPVSINTAGDITGIYWDTSKVGHSFLRAADGTMTYPVDAPGEATTGKLRGSPILSINTAGVITGGYEDASGVLHGFVRAADGTITPFEAPGAGTAGTSLFPGTAGVSINDLGDITGTYADASGVLHGFVLKLAIAPETQVANLQNIVEALVSAGTLNPGLGPFLLAPLNAALADLDPGHDAAATRAALDRGHTAAAIRELNEFIGRVRLLVIFRRLKPAEGRILIDAADNIITALRA